MSSHAIDPASPPATSLQPRAPSAPLPLPARIGIVGVLSGIVSIPLWIGLPMCGFAAMTGLPCPGCGLTRSTHAILRGDLAHAYHTQPFAFVVSPLLGAMVAYAAITFLWKGQPSLPAFARRSGLVLLAVLAALMLVFWAVRFTGFWGGPVPV